MTSAARWVLSSQIFARHHRELYSLNSSCHLLNKLFSTESHDDFKSKTKAAPPAADVSSIIKQDISSNDVFIFMKGVPEAPNCGFSNMACRVLDAYGVKYGARNVLTDANIREGIKKFSNWPTIPQIYVKGDFIGGADILMSMHESGELEKLLAPLRSK